MCDNVFSPDYFNQDILIFITEIMQDIVYFFWVGEEASGILMSDNLKKLSL